MSKSTDKNQLIICVVFERLLCVFIIWQKAAHTTFVNEAEKKSHFGQILCSDSLMMTCRVPKRQFYLFFPLIDGTLLLGMIQE